MIESLKKILDQLNGLKKIHAIAVPVQKKAIIGVVWTPFYNKIYKVS